MFVEPWKGAGVNKSEVDSFSNAFGKFIYSKKATKFCEIFALLLSYVVPVKSKVKILQNFVAFSEYMNFTIFFIALYIN